MHLFSASDDSFCDLLLCDEDAGVVTDDTLLLHGFHGVSPAKSYSSSDNQELPVESDESMAGFVEGESAYSPAADYPARFRSHALDSAAREEAVSWIFKVHTFYSFRPSTAYLSVNYMDRFLSAHCLPKASGWPFQLLAVACLSLAAKMEETLVPSLLDLQVEGDRYIFEPPTICRMELLVLTALKWRLRSITPFTFIDYFAYKADPSGTCIGYLVSSAVQIILATTYGIDFLDQCPSSIAAAAIICATASTPDLPFIGPENAAKWCIGLTRDGISACYQLMQQAVVVRSIQRRSPRIPPQLPVLTLGSLSTGASSSSYSNKRRKLNNCLWVDEDKEVS